MNEAERYKIQQAQPWLERVNIAARAAKRAQLLVETLERVADGAGGIDYTREHVSGGDYTDRMADAMDGLLEARAKAETAMVDYRREVNNAAWRLRGIEPDAFAILAACYLEGKETVADAFAELNAHREQLGLEPYHGSTIYRKHKEALLAAFDAIPTEWRDPRPSAI